MSYFKRKEISNSDLSYLSISVQHLLNARMNKKEPTPQMTLGSLVHCLALEPDKYELEFVVEPQIDKRTKQGKLDYAEFIKENTKTTITTDQYNLASNIAKSLYKCNRFNKILKGAEIEKEIYFTQFGVDCRSKLDIISDVIYDLKTIDDISDEGIKRNIYGFKYYRQMAFYINALNKEKDFTFIFVEKKEPYAIRYISLDLHSNDLTFYDKGNLEIENALSKWRAFEFNELDNLGFTNETQVFSLNKFGV